ncbi:hypothetical protein PDIG_08780 [Penicillium digitatum PHI26]|uniref:Uncharacterized protein n=2 Tax=Penicillium digitatum TaxID=36651 RepID=K9GBS9_PEND2|nr:hypothetical protein PDIP_36810 [Penicillium digitatum Pd1]EKV16348.1 hypothetical protein PDIP_36810 [Penicillium digitatum Pd1]EKV18564.1 hypothetical protein PDIG_08780 [Penicillium digitatum PHI26]
MDSLAQNQEIDCVGAVDRDHLVPQRFIIGPPALSREQEHELGNQTFAGDSQWGKTGQ